MKIRKVLYVANSAIIGGGNISLLELAKNLNPDLFIPHVICPRPGPFVEELKINKVRVHVADTDFLSASSKSTQMKQILAFTAMFIREKFDILHANGPISYRIPAWAAKILGIKRVCHYQYPDLSAESAKWAYKIMPHAIIFCSQVLHDNMEPILRHVIPGAQFLHLENAVDISRFRPSPGRVSDIRNQIDSGSRPVVSLIGHISEVKGHKYFLEMAAILKKQGKEATFLIVGEDKSEGKLYERTMIEYAKALDVMECVRFVGFRKDIPEILLASDIIVQPSLEEGLPFALLEAMACGKPVVATPVGGVTKIVKHEITGLLIPPEDSASFAQAVASLLGDLEKRKAMGQNGRKLIEQNHSISAYARNIESIYLSLMNPSGF